MIWVLVVVLTIMTMLKTLSDVLPKETDPLHQHFFFPPIPCAFVLSCSIAIATPRINFSIWQL